MCQEGHIRSETTFRSSSPIRTVGIMDSFLGIHLSVQTEMDEPSPTCFTKPFESASRSAIMARQVTDEPQGVPTCMKSVVGKYFPFRTRPHNDSGLVISRQPCLPRSARLKLSRSLKPIPPLIFGVASCSQLIQCMEQRSRELLHQ